MENGNKKKWVAVWVVSVVFVIAALSLLCVYLYRMYSAGRSYDDISSLMSESALTDSSSEPADSLVSESDTTDATSSSAASSKNVSSNDDGRDVVNGDVNFTELWKVNPDMYAWIKIPNTNVDYPVLQTSGDDGFYLEHNYKKEYEFAGSIYTEKLNKKDFSDPNTVLYGHNMLNGTMFRTLHNFRDPDFFAANPYIYILLPDRTLTYEIFSAYEYDDRHILYSFDFSDEDVYAEYLAYATNPTESMMCNRREIEVTTDDKIITLSTCLGNIDTSRYLVQGVLISDEPAAN